MLVMGRTTAMRKSGYASAQVRSSMASQRPCRPTTSGDVGRRQPRRSTARRTGPARPRTQVTQSDERARSGFWPQAACTQEERVGMPRDEPPTSTGQATADTPVAPSMTAAAAAVRAAGSTPAARPTATASPGAPVPQRPAVAPPPRVKPSSRAIAPRATIGSAGQQKAGTLRRAPGERLGVGHHEDGRGRVEAPERRGDQREPLTRQAGGRRAGRSGTPPDEQHGHGAERRG